jgi:hypothetical protein
VRRRKFKLYAGTAGRGFLGAAARACGIFFDCKSVLLEDVGRFGAHVCFSGAAHFSTSPDTEQDRTFRLI